MRDDLADAVSLVAAGVIAVMMRVEQHRDALGRALLQAGDADFSGVHELAVDGEGAVAVHEIANGAALADEHADTAAKLLESRDRRRCRLRRGLAHETFRDKASAVRGRGEWKRRIQTVCDSWSPPGTRNSILDWLLAATVAIAAISGLAGIDSEIGGLSVRSHGPLRVLALGAVLIAIRLRMGVGSIAASG